MLGVRHRLSVGLGTPSIVSLYGVVPDFSETLVVGISQTDLRERYGVSFAVRDLVARYLAPARLEDQLVVTTRVGPAGARRRIPRCFLTVTSPPLPRRLTVFRSLGWCEPIGCFRSVSCAVTSVRMASGIAGAAPHAARSCIASRCTATCMPDDERDRGADTQAAGAGRLAK